jgi:archaemetzincin
MAQPPLPKIEPLGFDPSFAFDARRGQYDSTLLLDRLPRGMVAVTDLDLMIPILEFVFGEAELGGRRAIVSTHRLHQEFYGLAADENLLQARVRKEVHHEWGHALGLRHCRRYDCVMSSSASVDQVDIKGEEFCEHCLLLLERGPTGSTALSEHPLMRKR